MIFDLSSPHSKSEPSVHDLIDKEPSSLLYVKIDDAIQIIQQFGIGSLMCKTDMTDAFKQIPISHNQWHLFCFKWKTNYYHYVRLPFGCRSSPKLFDTLSFGCRSSPKLFDTLSSAICWIAKNNYRSHDILHLLDYF